MIDPRTLEMLENALARLAGHIQKAAPHLDRPGTKMILRKLQQDVSYAQAAQRILAGECAGVDSVTAMAMIMTRPRTPALRIVGGTDMEVCPG